MKSLKMQERLSKQQNAEHDHVPKHWYAEVLKGIEKNTVPCSPIQGSSNGALDFESREIMNRC